MKRKGKQNVGAVDNDGWRSLPARRYRLTLPGAKFRLLIHVENGTLMSKYQQVFFVSHDSNVIKPVPFAIPPDAIGEPLDAVIRNISGELVIKEGAHDIWEDAIDDSTFIVDSLDELRIFLEECKSNRLQDVMEWVASTGAVVVCTTLVILLKLYWLLVPIGAVATFILYHLIRAVLTLSSNTIYDEDGLWVNTDTGRSNLNGGQLIKSKEDKAKQLG